MREGVLIIPTDSDKAMTLLSFFTQSVLLPPGGEPVLVDDIWQIGPIGREYADRPGDSASSRRPRNAPRFWPVWDSRRPRSAGSATGRR
jgi:hypothetical protein